MRVALFSPLPPCRSGIADYSETLVEHLKPLVDLEVFADGDRPFDPSRFDIALYHLGNNPHHGFDGACALNARGVVFSAAALPQRDRRLFRNPGRTSEAPGRSGFRN